MLGFTRQAALKRLRRNITLAHVLSGDARAPVSAEDLYLYLKHVEYSVENLQFILWYQDYRARFFDLPKEMQQLSPRLEVFSRSRSRKVTRAEQASQIADARSRCPHRSSLAPKVSLDVDLASESASSSGLVSQVQSPRLLHVEDDPSRDRESSQVPWEAGRVPSSNAASGRSAAHRQENYCKQNFNAYTADQPFRDECMRAAAVFFAEGSPHELSLDQEVREFVLSNLEYNTHPDIFLSAYDEVYTLIETSSFPQFLIVQSMNINMPRRVAWLLLGLTTFTTSIAIALCVVMFVDITSQSRRAFRLLALPFAAMGVMQIFSAYQGFCTLVWWSGKTQVKEWELGDQSIIQLVDQPSRLVDRELGMVQGFASCPRKSFSQVERIAPFITASAVSSVPNSVSLAQSEIEPPSRVSHLIPKSSSNNPLLRQNQTIQHAFRSATREASGRQVSASEIAEESASTHTVQCIPSLDIPALPKSTLPDQDVIGDVRSQTSREPSVAPLTHRFRTKLLGHGPVFGRQKQILDSRIISAQGKTFRRCMFVGLVTVILFASIILPMPSPNIVSQ